jgi:membrane-bound lytic murein transglycosylase D
MPSQQEGEFGHRPWVRLVCFYALALLLLASGRVAQAELSVTFPVPEVLRPNVAFWRRIFTKLDSHSGILHDTTDVSIVYQSLPDLPTSSHQRQRLIDRQRRRYRHILQRLAQGKRHHLSRDERRVLALFKGKQTTRVLRTAAQNIRFQLGLSDRFAQGLRRSGAYMPTIRQIFAAAGLPVELAWLPHVESSFNSRAYSKYGAAGMWQFTRSTGRRFLRVDWAIDERLDYRRATVAAAQLLQENYQELGTWPLAITAYNHGVHGMERAVARLKTRDFGTIVQRYHSRTFQFASRNFYAEFLAVVDIMQNHRAYFPDLTFDPPEAYHALKLDAYIHLGTLTKYLGVEHQEMASWNPFLLQPILRGQRLLPKDVVLYIPHHRLSLEEVRRRWASIPATEKRSQQHYGGKYRVQPGDTLSAIAQRSRTSVDTLMALNDLDRSDLIKAGQLLQLPKQSQRRAAAARTTPKTNAKTLAATRTPDQGAAMHDAMVFSTTDAQLASQSLMDELSVHELRISATTEWLRVQDETIRVVATETLGLYADWLDISIHRLRTLNRLSRRQSLTFGTRLRLDFSKVSADLFAKRRLEYHRRIEENFFRAYAVDGVITHTLKRGETLWNLARREYDVPLWLLQKYNYDLDFNTLSPGTKLRIPQVVEKTS